MSMIDSIKKTMLAGLGAAMITKDKVEATLSEFVEQGKVTAEDAKSMAEKVAEDSRKEFDQVSEQLNTKFKAMLAKLNEDTREQVAALEARVTALEIAHNKPAAKPAVKSAAKKKS